jgi:Nif-specific regulatory protein/two-component system response regulator HydG
VDFYPALLSIAKVLLREDGAHTAEVLLRRVVELTEADRGFIVVRTGDAFEQRFDVRFGAEEDLGADVRQFSRSLVRLAIDKREQIDTVALPAAGGELGDSVAALAGRHVLVAPFSNADQVVGVVYLEKQGAAGFAADAKRFLSEFSEVAGLFLSRAIERDDLVRQRDALERGLFARHDFQGIVTQDPAMLALLATVAQVADSTASILVRGETGTGKELVARALHANATRRHRPFVVIHCTALAANVLESELFGHVRGAFTGADRARAGRIAAAEGGTLFLDEIAEIPIDVQAKLLRFLQFGEVQRVGSDTTDKVDVRVVAATHQSLAQLVKDGRFRQDLYYRLNVVELSLPPLRDRPRDVALLLDHFLATHWRRAGEAPRWSAAAERALSVYEFPGNVRELAHIVERACLLARGPVLDVDLLPAEVASLAAKPLPPSARGRFSAFSAEELEAARQGAVDDAEREFVTELMRAHGGNVSRASRASGVHRTYLHKLLARHRAKGD